MPQKLVKKLKFKIDRKFNGSVAPADKTHESVVGGKVSANVVLGNLTNNFPSSGACCISDTFFILSYD